MSYACIDWKNPALWWSTAEPAIYFIVSKFCLEIPVMELFYILKKPHMHGDAKCWDSSRIWCTHSAPMEDKVTTFKIFLALVRLWASQQQRPDSILPPSGWTRICVLVLSKDQLSTKYPIPHIQQKSCSPDGKKDKFPSYCFFPSACTPYVFDKGSGKPVVAAAGKDSWATAALQDLCPGSGLLSLESSCAADTYAWSQS